MVTIACFLAALIPILFCVMPGMSFYSTQHSRKRADEYQLFKLRAVREYYEALENDSYKDIQRNYDVERAYNNIGHVSGKNAKRYP